MKLKRSAKKQTCCVMCCKPIVYPLPRISNHMMQSIIILRRKRINWRQELEPINSRIYFGECSLKYICSMFPFRGQFISPGISFWNFILGIILIFTFTCTLNLIFLPTILDLNFELFILIVRTYNLRATRTYMIQLPHTPTPLQWAICIRKRKYKKHVISDSRWKYLLVKVRVLSPSFSSILSLFFYFPSFLLFILSF